MAPAVASHACTFCSHGSIGRTSQDDSGWQVYPPHVDRTLVRAVVMAVGGGPVMALELPVVNNEKNQKGAFVFRVQVLSFATH